MPEEQPGCTILPMSLATDIRSYQPFNQQEASDREVILRQLETDPLRVKPDENSGVRWMDFDEALAASTEPWMRDRIYRKLVDKLAAVDLEMRR